MKIKNLILLIVILVNASVAIAQENNAGIFRFIDLPASPLNASLGGNTVSLQQNDLLSHFANPAYYDSTFNNSAQFLFYSHFADASMSSIAFAKEYRNIGLFTTAIHYFSYGDFKRFDEFGFENGTFNAYDMSLSLALSRPIAQSLSAGIAIQLLRSSIERFYSHGITFSGGLLYHNEAHLFTLGMAIQHIGFQLDTFNGEREPIPYQIALGVSKRLQHVPFRFTLTAHHLQEWPLKTIYDSGNPSLNTNLLRHFSAGGEFLFSSHFSFLFGINKYEADAISTDSRLDFSGTGFGISIKTHRFHFDFSRTSYSDVGSHLLFSIITHF